MSDIQEEIEVQENITSEVPWDAIILNDDKTSFDVVELILTSVFNRSKQEAADIAMRVHTVGLDVAGGPYTEKEAKSRCTMAMNIAKTFNMPLQLVAKKSA